MLKAGAATGARWELNLFCCIEILLFKPPVQVLKVSGVVWRSLVVQFVPSDVVIVLCGLLFDFTPLHGGSMVVVIVVQVVSTVGVSVGLASVILVGMMGRLAIAVLVRVAVMLVEAIMEAFFIVATLVTRGFLWIERGPLALGCCAVFPYFIDEKDFRHVVDD